MVRYCEYCACEFHIPPSKRLQRFCSKPCRVLFEHGPPDLIRQCTKCHNEYPATGGYFRENSGGRHGLTPECITCLRKRAIEYNRRKPDKQRQGVVNFRKNHPEHVKDLKRASYQRNRESVIAAAKQYRKNTPGYWRIDPVRDRAKQAKRRALKLGSQTHYTATDIRKQLEVQGDRCFYCKQALRGKRFHVDHYMPLSLGGSNGPENIVIACPHCNLSKNDRHPTVFISELAERVSNE